MHRYILLLLGLWYYFTQADVAFWTGQAVNEKSGTVSLISVEDFVLMSSYVRAELCNVRSWGHSFSDALS